MKYLSPCFLTLLAVLLVCGGPDRSMGAEPGRQYRFVMIPKVVHPWFDLVYEGAQTAVQMLNAWTDAEFEIEYLPPQRSDVGEQNKLLAQVIDRRPDGIMIDLLDAARNRYLLQKALAEGIPVVVFDSVPPEGMALTSVGNDFCEQAQLASHRLAALLDGRGEVAIMMGVPTAPNHNIRARCHEEALKQYPHIRIVARGVDHDDIATAKAQASAIMKAHPNLRGWVSCDAAGPIGIGQAIEEAGKVGEVLSVGTDDLPELLALIRAGVVDSSTATKPRMQGYWSVLSLWQATLGIPLPKHIDTGIAIVTRRLVKDYKGF